MFGAIPLTFILCPRMGTEQARGCHLCSSSSSFQRDDLKTSGTELMAVSKPKGVVCGAGVEGGSASHPVTVGCSYCLGAFLGWSRAGGR